jgi:hypothetical protein
MRSHLASVSQLGTAARQIVTYDERMAEAARAHGWSVAAELASKLGACAPAFWQ